MRTMRGARGRRVATVALLITVTGAVGASGASRQAQAGPAYKKAGAWGKSGTANGQFTNATGLATDKAGKVYVADTDNHRVQVFSSKGGFVRKVQFSAASFIQDVAVSPDGSLWATDLNAFRAQQFSAGGGELATITTPKLARGVAVDANGSVFVVTAGDNIARVDRYDTSATGDWGVGRTLTGFRDPHDVEVSPDGSVYVADNGSLTVKRFDAGGKLVKTIKGGRSAPLGIGVDLDCNVWITNISERRLDRFSPSGKLLGSAASPDLIARDIAVGPTGDLYAYDSGVASIVRFAEDRSKPGDAAVVGKITVAGKVAKLTYSLPGVACPAQIDATATLKGNGVSGSAKVKVGARKTTTIRIPLAKAPPKGSQATFTIVLKTNGRPTTQTRVVQLG